MEFLDLCDICIIEIFKNINNLNDLINLRSSCVRLYNLSNLNYNLENKTSLFSYKNKFSKPVKELCLKNINDLDYEILNNMGFLQNFIINTSFTYDNLNLIKKINANITKYKIRYINMEIYNNSDLNFINTYENIIELKSGLDIISINKFNNLRHLKLKIFMNSILNIYIDDRYADSLITLDILFKLLNNHYNIIFEKKDFNLNKLSIYGVYISLNLPVNLDNHLLQDNEYLPCNLEHLKLEYVNFDHFVTNSNKLILYNIKSLILCSSLYSVDLIIDNSIFPNLEYLKINLLTEKLKIINLPNLKNLIIYINNNNNICQYIGLLNLPKLYKLSLYNDIKYENLEYNNLIDNLERLHSIFEIDDTIYKNLEKLNTNLFSFKNIENFSKLKILNYNYCIDDIKYYENKINNISNLFDLKYYDSIFNFYLKSNTVEILHVNKLNNFSLDNFPNLKKLYIYNSIIYDLNLSNLKTVYIYRSIINYLNCQNIDSLNILNYNVSYKNFYILSNLNCKNINKLNVNTYILNNLELINIKYIYYNISLLDDTKINIDNLSIVKIINNNNLSYNLPFNLYDNYYDYINDILLNLIKYEYMFNKLYEYKLLFMNDISNFKNLEFLELNMLNLDNLKLLDKKTKNIEILNNKKLRKIIVNEKNNDFNLEKNNDFNSEKNNDFNSEIDINKIDNCQNLENILILNSKIKYITRCQNLTNLTLISCMNYKIVYYNKLERLYIKDCNNINIIPPVDSLKYLYINNCNNIFSIKKIDNLMECIIENCNIEVINNLLNLKFLKIVNCNKLYKLNYIKSDQIIIYRCKKFNYNFEDYQKYDDKLDDDKNIIMGYNLSDNLDDNLYGKKYFKDLKKINYEYLNITKK